MQGFLLKLLEIKKNLKTKISRPGLAGWLGPSLRGKWAPPPPGADHAGLLAPLIGASKKRPPRTLVRATLGHQQCPHLAHLLTIAKRACHQDVGWPPRKPADNTTAMGTLSRKESHTLGS